MATQTIKLYPETDKVKLDAVCQANVLAAYQFMDGSPNVSSVLLTTRTEGILDETTGQPVLYETWIRLHHDSLIEYAFGERETYEHYGYVGPV